MILHDEDRAPKGGDVNHALDLIHDSMELLGRMDHKDISDAAIEARLQACARIEWSLKEMELTGVDDSVTLTKEWTKSKGMTMHDFIGMMVGAKGITHITMVLGPAIKESLGKDDRHRDMAQ